jgi:indole-3-glycerol phosphate synthase
VTTSSVLEKIAESTRRRVGARREVRSFHELERDVRIGRKPLDFIHALSQGPQPRVIAEVKSKSPSRGVIRTSADGDDAISKALDFQKAGAAAISVLTEPEYFAGQIENLSRIREQAPNLALLQKDFIVDIYQIYEALAFGADAVLLILSLLGEAKAREFFQVARSLGLTALVEVHNEEEMKMALRMQAPLIGVNNRDLRSLAVSLDVSRNLAPMIPLGALVISESGIESREQILEFLDLGYRGFLIGTSLMQSPDPAMALSRLIRGTP